MATADREVREALERAQADLKSTQRELDREREQVRDLEARAHELAVQSRENDTLRQLAAGYQAQLEQAQSQLKAMQAQLKAPTDPMPPLANDALPQADRLPNAIFAIFATLLPLGLLILFAADAGEGLAFVAFGGLLFYGVFALFWFLRRIARWLPGAGPAREPGSDADRLPPESLSPEDSQRARERTGAER